MADPLIEAARASIALGSQSFALASRLFDPATRGRAWLLYCWCRHCDDVVDGQSGGGASSGDPADIAARVARLRADTHAALTGRPPALLPFEALARVADETGIPSHLPFALIDGFAMDAASRRYDTPEQLLDYCYHVAGCVGEMMAIVMGVEVTDAPTLRRAADLGLSFQLNNIARDVIDDARVGRCYLPVQWLHAEGLTAETLALPAKRDALARVAARLVALAERYEDSARHGTPALGPRAAWAVLAAASIYGDIGRRVRAKGAHAWDQRVHTSRGAKLLALARAAGDVALRRLRWPAETPRPELWSKPGHPA